MPGELTLSTFRLTFSAEKRVILPPLQQSPETLYLLSTARYADGLSSGVGWSLATL
jgi:hypothetical protein